MDYFSTKYKHAKHTNRKAALSVRMPPKVKEKVTRKVESCRKVAKQLVAKPIGEYPPPKSLLEKSLPSFPQTPACSSATFLSSLLANQILPSKIWKEDRGIQKQVGKAIFRTIN